MIGLGSVEVLLLLAIAFVLLRGIPRVHLFAYAYKYRGPRTRTRTGLPDMSDLVLETTVILVVLAAVVFGVVTSAN